MKWCLSLFLILFAVQSAHSDESCSTVELDKDNHPLAGVPAWDQGADPSCYVYSSTALAMVWVREIWGKRDSSLLKFSSDAEKNYQQIKKSPEYKKILDAERGRTCQALQYILKTAFNQQDQIARKNFDLPGCEMWGIDLNSAGTHKVLRTPDEFQFKIHQLLTKDANPLPFGIEYCSNISNIHAGSYIVNRTFRPNLAYLNSNASSENFAEDCGFHSAVVIGQKMRSGVCYFKVRNSDGTYHPFDLDNEDGNDWIPAESLARNTLRLILLTSP